MLVIKREMFSDTNQTHITSMENALKFPLLMELSSHQYILVPTA